MLHIANKYPMTWVAWPGAARSPTPISPTSTHTEINQLVPRIRRKVPSRSGSPLMLAADARASCPQFRLIRAVSLAMAVTAATFLGLPGDPGRPEQHHRSEGPNAHNRYFLVSQKILSISAIWASSSSATATSVVFLASPAFLVAFQNRSWSWGYFSRCSGLK